MSVAEQTTSKVRPKEAEHTEWGDAGRAGEAADAGEAGGSGGAGLRIPSGTGAVVSGP